MTIGVAGVTGAVGRTMLRVLRERGWAVDDLRAFASKESEGRRLDLGEGSLAIEAISETALASCDLALFALDDDLAREWIPRAREHGVRVVDNSAAYRLAIDVPLVVPEVNGHLLDDRPSLVANPNCSTIALVVAVAPLLKAAGVRRLHCATYQSASGAGQAAEDELRQGAECRLRGDDDPSRVFPKPLAFNCLPQIGALDDDGVAREEWKMLAETRRILDRPALRASFTCVRVPTFVSHALAVHVETERPLSVPDATGLLERAAGLVVGDGVSREWPTPRDAEGIDDVLVGRIRRDPASESGLLFWVVGDNLRKGAATNAIQIAERLLRS